MAKSIVKDEDESSKKWPSPKVESFFQKWKRIFIASCLFAVLLDPLFLYIPMMKDDIKCMLSDKNLKIAALLLRSLTDLFYIFDIIFQIYTSDKYSTFMHEYRSRHHRSKKRYWRKFFVPTIIKTMWGSYSILIDILAILPLPQIAILIIFSETSNLRSLTAIRMVIMNLFVLLQYVPRVLRFYLLCKELKMTPKKEIEETAKWVKGVLNFFMYILSSHVLGAVWYFFAIQRMATCWHNACGKANGCNTGTFGCHDHHTDRNITFLNDLCPISPVNTTLFDFGIYITVLQSGIMGSTNYFQKFSNCFWWGLRNLSSLGSNLEPSVDGWENLFAASVSIIGLLLFLYLIGNLQTYMQLDTARIEAYRHNMKVKQKMEKKDKEIELWLSANGIAKSFKSQIMEKVRQELEENRDAGLDHILSILPSDLQRQITDCKNRHEMKGRETELWLSENGIPKSFKSQIMEKVRQELEENRDADLDYILSILPLDLQRQITDCKHRHEMKRRETELWLSENGIPKSFKSQIMEKVRQELEENRDAGLDYILSILPLDLQRQITYCKMKGRETELWLSENGIPKSFKSQIMEKVRQELEENRDAGLDHILSILPSDLQRQITDCKYRHEMKGRETELWLSANGIPKSFKSQIMEKVRQELQENRDAGLDHILSILPSDLQTHIKNCTPMARLKQVPMLRNMDEDVLIEIYLSLKPMEFDDNSIIIEKGKPLEMIFIVDGLVSIEKRDGSSSSNNNLQQRTRGAGEVCGEQLLLSPLSAVYPFNLILATESAKAIGHVEALVLTFIELQEVVGRDYFFGMICRIFSANELEKATDNYHPVRIIRKGENATFYKGVLPMPDDDKTVVAVKKYRHMDVDAATEAAVASQTNHINVVRFLGACVEFQTQALVFEYIPNGTLFEHIHKEEAAGSSEGSSSSPTALLSLELRLKIASETAGALAYLHSLNPPIMHLRLSTKHILLDHHYTAKLSAIGQWRSSSFWDNSEYFDPRFSTDRLAEKSDVYSFGVVLAELLTSQKPASPSRREEPPLAICLLSSMEEGRLDQILDAQIIVNEATSETAKKVADLAKRCLISKREERPSMEQVAVELEGLRKFMAEY